MKKETNTWLTDEGSKQIDFYLSSSDIFLIERKRTVKLLIDIFRYHIKNKKQLKLLDLGCGDGTITKNISGIYPENEYHLLDGSNVMIEKAKENLKGNNFKFIIQSFEDYIKNSNNERKYDFIYSAMAIHHLNYSEKQNIFNTIHKELKLNGLFLNIDIVMPESYYTEELQFKMWVDWINESLYKKNKNDVGKYNDLPVKVKAKEENKPTRLFKQLNLLRNAGFRDVDCYYKYGVFALYGGFKK